MEATQFNKPGARFYFIHFIILQATLSANKLEVIFSGLRPVLIISNTLNIEGRSNYNQSI